MIKEILINAYTNDLQRVIGEIEKYKSDDDLWLTSENIPNSGGNLALHLIGNIKHFFGSVLGETGYIRERDLEFSAENIPRADIISALNEASEVLKTSLSNLSDEDFYADYPEEIFGGVQKTPAVAVYMLNHLNYHLGQINYHRRLLADKSN